MARLKRKEGKLTAADLASYGILPKQPNDSTRVKGQESETPDGAAERSDSLTDRRDGRAAQQLNLTQVGVTVSASQIESARGL
jgi:hypothetical protein